MAQYDLYRLGEQKLLVIDVQSDHISDVTSRVVIPLIPSPTQTKPPTRLHPTMLHDGAELELLTTQLFSVESRVLAKPLGNLAQERDRITAALDFLFQGF